MSTSDSFGHPLSGGTPSALPLYERALEHFLAWRAGAESLVDEALERAPRFVMGHALKACLLAAGRDPRRVRAARASLDAAVACPANDHERLHVCAIERILADDFEGAAARFALASASRPHDLLALAMACGIDYLAGEAQRMRSRIEQVLPAWSRSQPAYHCLRAMQAFGLAECGDYGPAEEAALDALSLAPDDARAHHAMSHVHEMTDRPDDGARWLRRHAPAWSRGSTVATHCWWHLALFELARHDHAAVLELYDQRIRAGRPGELGDLIDASALLWRLRLRGVATGARPVELATAWEAHIDDGYCSFSDLHAMLAFVGAGDWAQAQRLERTLAARQRAKTRHGWSTRHLGLPACRGLMAYGRGDFALATSLLAALPASVHRLGGSHAQRDVLHLTLLQAIQSLRRPLRRATQETSRPPQRNALAASAA